MWLKRIYVLVFIELTTRRVHLAGCTTNPDGAWVTQQAKNFTFHLDERAQPLRFLIHDRDAKFRGPFDEVLATEGFQVVCTPIGAPRANGICEGWIRTVRTECLDWLLLQTPPRARRQGLHSSLQPPATSPCATTSSTGAGRVREDAASR